MNNVIIACIFSQVILLVVFVDYEGGCEVIDGLEKGGEDNEPYKLEEVIPIPLLRLLVTFMFVFVLLLV